MRFLKGLVVAILVLVCMLGAAAATIYFIIPQEPQTQAADMQDGVYNFLCAGVDGEKTNADTLVLVTYDTEANTLRLLSIPRDTMSNVQDRSIKKINGSYGEGGIRQTIEEVEMLTSLKIDRYIVTTFDGFEKAIDAIGGVDIDLPEDMYYADPYQDLEIDLKSGPQHLNGEDALKFVRYRAGYITGDLGRIEAQQLFFEALGKQMLSVDTIRNTPALMDVIKNEMETDLTINEMLFFAKKASALDMETGVTMLTLPGAAEYVDELSYFIPSQEGILEMLNKYYAFGDKTYTAEDLDLVDLAAMTEAQDYAGAGSMLAPDEGQTSANEYQPPIGVDPNPAPPAGGGYNPGVPPQQPAPQPTPPQQPTPQPTPPPADNGGGDGGSDYQGY